MVPFIHIPSYPDVVRDRSADAFLSRTLLIRSGHFRLAEPSAPTFLSEISAPARLQPSAWLTIRELHHWRNSAAGRLKPPGACSSKQAVFSKRTSVPTCVNIGQNSLFQACQAPPSRTLGHAKTLANIGLARLHACISPRPGRGKV